MSTAQTLILFHATLGGIALVAGTVALAVTKGNRVHRTCGKIFYWSMLLSAVIALIISGLPEHENPFLFSIGVFSLYLILGGRRALQFKKSSVNFRLDKVLSIIMLIVGVLMILTPILLRGKLNIILSVFGLIGLVLAYRDLQLFNKPDKLRKGWLKMHLGKMTGGYIAAFTAFIVVNHIIPGLYGWLAPTAAGLFYIRYHFRKLS